MSEKPRYRVKAGSSRVAMAYTAGSHGPQELAGWNPRLTGADAEILRDRNVATARVRDLVRNSGWIAGGVDSKTDAVVGANIWLNATPDYEAMGQSADWAFGWAAKTEAWFRTWANDVRRLNDLERHQTFGAQARLLFQHYLIDGECIAINHMKDRGGPFAMAVQVIDPDRLSNPNGGPDDRWMRGGVELDANGAAVAYHIQKGHPNDIAGGDTFDRFRWVRMLRETRTGRPYVVHWFNKRRAHQRKGISSFVSAVLRSRALDRYDQAELQAAMQNAVLATWIESPFDAALVDKMLAPAAPSADESISAYQDFRVQYHEDADLRIGGANIPLLAPGEQIKVNRAERPSGNFAAFESAVLRSIAAPMGLTYEQLSRDWSQVNYSSARAALIEVWRGFITERTLFSQHVLTPIYASWLEEAVARRYVTVPGGMLNFYRWRTALVSCDWIGPGRGWVDPKKEAEAAQLRQGMYLTAPSDEAAEQGSDFRQVTFKAARDRKTIKDAGLPDPFEIAAAAAQPH